jgi:hypothetical protein
MLQYLKEYYDHPERFAWHYIKCIPGNLGKSSSQPAKANHASITAHLGPGSTQDMVTQINDLLSRQSTLDTANANADAKYKLISDQLACEAEEQNKPEEAKALRTLSSFGYNEYWKSAVERSQDYTLLPDQGDEHDRVHRKGTSMESVRLIPKDGRCNCDFHLEAQSMCPHEYVRGGRVFDAALFPERLLQPHKMKAIDPVPVPSQGNEETFSDGSGSDGFFQNDDDTDVDDNDPGALFGEVTHVKSARDENEATSNNNTTVSLSVPIPRRRKCQKAVGHAQLMKEAIKLANYASNAPPKLREAVYTSLIMMREIVEGTSQEAPHDVVETLQNAMSRRTSTTNGLIGGEPKAGPEANKPGAPWQSRLVSLVMARNGGTKPKSGGRTKNKCKFCGATTCGNVSTCLELKSIGTRISLHDLGSFVQKYTVYLHPSNARMDENAKARLVTSERPVLSSLPKETKWLVIHGLYNLQTLSSAMTYILQEETQMGIEVSCIGLAGVTIDLGNGMYFGNRMAHYNVVRDWLASTAKQSCGRTYSRVILSHDFNMPLANNSSYGGVNDIVRL